MMDGRALYILLISLVFANADSNITMIANDFVFTFINLYTEGKSGFILLVLVSNNNNRTANVTVDSPYPSFNNITVSVAPYSILKIPITPESIQAQYLGNMTTARGQVTVEDKGVRLQSDLPVSVYAHAEVSDGQNADSFLVLPAVHLGTEYVAVTSTDPNAPNMIAVVAYQDNTQISLPTQGVTLNALQVASVTVKTAVSCSIISGNKPFGVISGCTCGTVDGICGYEAVMSFPVDDWGTQFAAIPLMFLTMNYYQVIANTDNTVVSVGEGTTIVTLNAGEYQRFQIGAALVTSNYPIQLIQIGQNTGEKGNNTGGPFFLQLPSTDKMSNTNVLFQPTGFFEYKGVHLVFFLRIVTNLAGTGTIQLYHIHMEMKKAVGLSAHLT
uniref:IgGFc-binding protein N-terminal domain-containing protein n=1 Tax=Plectus sambesii TaxID=2011161 RepID=A0A914V7V1_9BILA